MICTWAPVDGIEDGAEVAGQRVSGGDPMLPEKGAELES
jgi:hypothetical protein